ncbi:MAG: ACT domain-containing protein [Candidatus Omnitrophota bacterium]
MNKHKNYIIEITVRNHAGVMSHITGLFSRRAFNLEAIICVPTKDSRESKIFLLVKNNVRIAQIIKQLQKLYDVLRVKLYLARGGNLSSILQKKCQ